MYNVSSILLFDLIGTGSDTDNTVIAEESQKTVINSVSASLNDLQTFYKRLFVVALLPSLGSRLICIARH